MAQITAPQLPSVAFLWPALAAVSASEVAANVAKELVGLALGHDTQPERRELSWTTRNKVALELTSVRLRDFSTASEGPVALVCAPFALHGASIADFAPHHSLVAALIGAGLTRVLVTDWRSAEAEMRFFSIDTYLADLNVLVDHVGGTVDLIGLCQGGWLALMYAARFPGKVRKLVLAGAPIDVAAGESLLSRLALETPLAIFKELVELGSGRVLGRHTLQFWGPASVESEPIREILQTTEQPRSVRFRRLEARFRDWYAWTVDLPGTYYLEVVERLFKENQLAAGRFVALGQKINLSDLHVPIFLVAARDDELVAPAQIFATEHLVGTRAGEVQKAIAPCSHLGLFMGRNILGELWPQVVRWLAQEAPHRGLPDQRARNAA